MAPEVTQANNAQPYDGQAADVWSLGVILYVLVSCAYPFGYDGPKEQVQTASCRAPLSAGWSWAVSEHCRAVQGGEPTHVVCARIRKAQYAQPPAGACP